MRIRRNDMTFKVHDVSTSALVSFSTRKKLAEGTGLAAEDDKEFAITEGGRVLLVDKHGSYIECDYRRFLPERGSKKYPDIEYFEAVLYANILKDRPDLKDLRTTCDTTVDMFSQTWASTAGGFEEPGMFAGQMMTTEPTTVLEMRVFVVGEWKACTWYGVFFGNRPAYIVHDPSPAFFDDLKNRNMKSRYEARSAY